MPEIKIDFSKTLRPMKPMHGVNNGPLTCNFTVDARDLFKEAGIPYSRLHDTEYPFGSGEFVDIPCVFKNFDADPEDPASYNFALTDLYLKAIDECDTKIIYRLGVSIEHNPVKRHIYPPKDSLKWAKICEGIIRHYNEGWADGYHLGIRYWEIWNEPNHMLDRKMWGGTVENFANLYTVASTYLKEKFPDLMIGGPAFSNPDSEFVREFFPLITKNGAHPPMDFYSWHGYVDTVEKAVARAESAQNILDLFGYSDAESIFDEWNYIKSWKNVGESFRLTHSFRGAAFFAAVMSAMQYTTCDIATYYDAQMKFASSWCALFQMNDDDRTNGGAKKASPLKGFYAFKAFNEVYRCKNQVDFTVDDERLYGVAASDGEKGAVLVSNFADVVEELPDKEVHFSFKGLKGKKASLYLCDETHDLEKIIEVCADEFTVTIPKYAFVLIKFN